jgi:hypothetical protein
MLKRFLSALKPATVRKTAEIFVSSEAAEGLPKEDLIDLISDDKEIIENMLETARGHEGIISYVIKKIATKGDISRLCGYLGITPKKTPGLTVPPLITALGLITTSPIEDVGPYRRRVIEARKASAMAKAREVRSENIRIEKEKEEKRSGKRRRKVDFYLPHVIRFLVDRYLLPLESGYSLTRTEYAETHDLIYWEFNKYVNELLPQAQIEADKRIEKLKRRAVEQEKQLEKWGQQQQQEIEEFLAKQRQEADAYRIKLAREQQRISEYRARQEIKERKRRVAQAKKTQLDHVITYLARKQRRKQRLNRNYSMKQYAEQEGIPYHEFRPWVIKHKAEAQPLVGAKVAEIYSIIQKKLKKSKRAQAKEQESKLYLEKITRYLMMLLDGDVSKAKFVRDERLSYPKFLSYIKIHGDKAQKVVDEHVRRSQLDPIDVWKEWANSADADDEDPWLDLAAEVDEMGLTTDIIIKWSEDIDIPPTLSDVFKTGFIHHFDPQDFDRNHLFSNFEITAQLDIAKIRIETALLSLKYFSQIPAPKDLPLTTIPSPPLLAAGTSLAARPEKAAPQLWESLTKWTKDYRPKVVVVGADVKRLLRAHGWLSEYFDLTSYSTTVTRREKGRGARLDPSKKIKGKSMDLLILFSGFMGHGQINKLVNAAPEGTPILGRAKTIKGISAAALQAHKRDLVPWFLEAYQAATGKSFKKYCNRCMLRRYNPAPRFYYPI